MGSLHHHKTIRQHLTNTLLLLSLLLITFLLHHIEATPNVETVHSIVIPNRFLAFRQLVTSAVETDMEIFDSTIAYVSAMQFSINGHFTATGSAFMYITPKYDQIVCNKSSCHYPGMWYQLPIEQLDTSLDTTPITWVNIPIRSAFTTLNKHLGTPPTYSNNYPNSFTIDFIVPMDNFVQAKGVKSTSWSLNTLIAPPEAQYQSFYLSSSGYYKHDVYDPLVPPLPYEAWATYGGYSMKIKELKQNDQADTIDIDLYTRESYPFTISSSSPMSFKLYPITEAQKLFDNVTGAQCNFSTYGVIQKQYWSVTFTSTTTYSINPYEFDLFPQRLSIKCTKAAYYTAPGWVYLWDGGEVKQIRNKGVTSIWPSVDHSASNSITPLMVVVSSVDGADGDVEDRMREMLNRGVKEMLQQQDEVQQQQNPAKQIDEVPLVPTPRSQVARTPTTLPTMSTTLYNTLIERKGQLLVGRVGFDRTRPFEASSMVEKNHKEFSTKNFTWAIVGPIIGVVGIIIISIVLCCCFCKRNHNNNGNGTHNDNTLVLKKASVSTAPGTPGSLTVQRSLMVSNPQTTNTAQTSSVQLMPMRGSGLSLIQRGSMGGPNGLSPSQNNQMSMNQPQMMPMNGQTSFSQADMMQMLQLMQMMQMNGGVGLSPTHKELFDALVQQHQQSPFNQQQGPLQQQPDYQQQMQNQQYQQQYFLSQQSQYEGQQPYDPNPQHQQQPYYYDPQQHGQGQEHSAPYQPTSGQAQGAPTLGPDVDRIASAPSIHKDDLPPPAYDE